MTKVIAERFGNKIILAFRFDASVVNRIKAIPGSRNIRLDDGTPAWTLPLDMNAGVALRTALGPELRLGPKLKSWGWEQVRQERKLKSLVLSDEAELTNLPYLLPALDATLRPYQRADVAFMAETSAINANEPRLGKTIETIAAVYEAGLQHGPQLVVAPSEQSMETVWRYELERWQRLPVYVLHGGTPSKERLAMDTAMNESEEGFWLVTSPNMVRSDFAQAWQWQTVTVDEFHRFGIADPKSATSRSLKALSYQRIWLLSGSPIGGIPQKLWGALNLMNPGIFRSKWRWFYEWLQVTEDEIYDRRGTRRRVKKIEGIRPDREADFYQNHAQYMVRRLKSEIWPQLPKQQRVEVMCRMTPDQAKQYKQFADAAELRIEELRLSSVAILSEYLWLKKLASTLCRLEEYEAPCKYCEREGYDVNALGECVWCLDTKIVTKTRALPTAEGGKLEALLDRLQESDEPAIVASQFSTLVDVVADWLPEQGIECVKMTGKTKKKGQRAEIIRQFQAGEGPRVIVMTTTLGGVSIELSKATTVHILDETWNPDDQEQLEERSFDLKRTDPVSCYYYRSRDTIDQYVAETTAIKADINAVVLDVHRKRLQELHTRAGGTSNR